MKAGYLCCFLYVTTFFLVAEVSSLIQGSYGGICLNECDFWGYSYTYCETTADSWDYCSNIAGVTSYTYGKVCREDHQCGFHNEKYLWCYYDDSDNWSYCSLYPDEAIITSGGKACMKSDLCTESLWYSSRNWCYTDDNNNWDYCKGTNTITDNDHLTRYGYHCKDSCEIYGRNTDHTCSYQYQALFLGLRSSSDYCSANPDSTYQGDACSSCHSCDRYGESYYWCYKQKGSWDSWDYCSPVENCGYWPLSSPRVKRQVETSVVCILPTASHNLEITMSSPNQINNQLQPITRRQMCQVQVTIAQWDRTSIDRGTRAGTLCQTDEYRIDLQGTFTENNIEMANIQVQSNGHNSQSVAGLHVPVGETFPIRRFRRALVESAQRQRFITMRY